MNIMIKNNFLVFFYYTEDSMLDTANSGLMNRNLSGMQFSTNDRDNDLSLGNCAHAFNGGWWFKMCHSVFLNGPWKSGNWSLPWNPKVTTGTQIKETAMMIKTR
jgi:hypothetical protein